jgi:hypothetical protein
MTLSIRTFSIMTLSIRTFSIMTLSIRTFSIIALNKTTLTRMTVTIMSLSIMAFGIITLCQKAPIIKTSAFDTQQNVTQLNDISIKSPCIMMLSIYYLA